MRVFKRYANRKMYDVSNSRYINLPEISSLVKQGVDILVVDNTTKQDRTRLTLAEILLSEIRKGESHLDITALRDLIGGSNETFSAVL